MLNLNRTKNILTLRAYYIFFLINKNNNEK